MVEATERLTSQASRSEIVAVMPAYNEERFIGSVVHRASEYATRVIVVDDGSTDGTAALARKAGAEVVRLSQNRGKGEALNAGFERARDLHPYVVVALDADAQHDPADIPRLAQPIIEGKADVVIGSRFLGTRSKIPRWRRVGQWILTRVTNAASGISITDSQSGYRAFSPLALQTLRFHSRGLAMESEMQFLLLRSSLRVTEVPISVQYRDGNKRNPVVHGLQVLHAILGLVARRRPLLFLGFGMLLSVLGSVGTVDAMYVGRDQHAVPIWMAATSELLLMVGLLLCLMGVVLGTLERFVARLGQEIQDVLARASGGTGVSYEGEEVGIDG